MNRFIIASVSGMQKNNIPYFVNTIIPYSTVTNSLEYLGFHLH